MHIGIDYTPATRQRGGIGRYVRELVRAVAAIDYENQYTLFLAGGRVSASDMWGGDCALMVSEGGEFVRYAQQALERSGYNVESARPGEALDALDQVAPDLIVTPQPTDDLRQAAIERGVRVLLAQLKGHQVVFEAPNLHFKSATISDVWLARLWFRLGLPIPVESLVGPVDIYHATDFVLPPTRRRTRTLLTVHDLSFVRDPRSTSPALKDYLNKVVPASVTRADHVLADSQATKEDLMELYSTSDDKVSVLYSGVDPRFNPDKEEGEEERVRRRYKLGHQPFILSLGTIHPRKNYRRLISAFSMVADVSGWIDRKPVYHNLVIVGAPGRLNDTLKSDVSRLGLRTRVIFTGFVDDVDLPALYRSADLFVFPSLYEGFGLPPLEAMACGTPVVTSNVSSLPEVVGDVGLMVDPTDVHELSRMMTRALQDTELRCQMIEGGLARARGFSWLRSAWELRGVYESLGQGHRPSIDPRP